MPSHDNGGSELTPYWRCARSTSVSAGPWPDDVQSSEIEPLFVCRVCGDRGADAKPIFSGLQSVGGLPPRIQRSYAILSILPPRTGPKRINNAANIKTGNAATSAINFTKNPHERGSSLRANGSRECATDDRLGEAIQNAETMSWIVPSLSVPQERAPLTAEPAQPFRDRTKSQTMLSRHRAMLGGAPIVKMRRAHRLLR